MYRTIEAAIQSLDDALAEIVEEQPDICVDSAWFEMGKALAEECIPEVKKQLLRYLGAG